MVGHLSSCGAACLWRVFTAIAIAALLSFISGCSTVVTSSVEEAVQRRASKLTAVEVPLAISGAEMKSGEVMVFRLPTGQYREATQELTGIGTTGDSVFVFLANVRFVHVRAITNSTMETTAMPVNDFFRTYSDQHSTGASNGPYPLSTRIKFEKLSGVIDTVKRTVTGQSRDGLAFEAGFADVSRVEYRRFSSRKTLTWVALYVGVALIVWASDPYSEDWHMEE